MKHVKNAAIVVCLLASISTEAQQSVKEPRRETKPTKVSPDDPVTEFKKRNKDVRSVRWRSGNIMRIEKIDGSSETYDLDNNQAQKKAERLYGALPPAPPPPPKVNISRFTPPPPPPLVHKKGT